MNFGESIFFKEFKRREMDAWMSSSWSKWGWGRWGNWSRSLIVDNKWTMNVYPVGPVDKDTVSKAIQKVVSSGSVGGYVLDFKPSTYHFTEHNSHHFTNAMLLLLKLPY